MLFKYDFLRSYHLTLPLFVLFLDCFFITNFLNFFHALSMATAHHRSVFFLLVLVLVLFTGGVQAARFNRRDSAILLPSEKQEPPAEEGGEPVGTRWAVLVAGSSGYANYRHQADVCHAYQLLRKGGLKEEHIVVFMYDDIAMHELNPRPGVIINHPQGENLYDGVPKDYTGEHVTAQNLYAVLLGDRKAVKGGSGKVVNSKANDRIFIFYSDHGGPGVLGMPNMPYVYAMEFIDVLKKKHAAKSYKGMVIYVEACESGSIFEGVMPKDLDIYVTTASNAQESSFGTYCPGMDPSPPPEYITCLGDLYSVAWMEDSETHNLKRETISQQYQAVKERTSNFNNYNSGSHVMEYGNTSVKSEKLYLYQGFDPASTNFPPNKLQPDQMGVVNQRDADLLFMWHMVDVWMTCKFDCFVLQYKNAAEGSEKKSEMLKQITETMRHRKHLDASIDMIGVILFGPDKGSRILNSVGARGLPLVDDWQCLKSMVRVFETHCGSLTQYGMKHMRAFANICNSGVSQALMEETSEAACSGNELRQWHPAIRGYSA